MDTKGNTQLTMLGVISTEINYIGGGGYIFRACKKEGGTYLEPVKMGGTSLEPVKS